MKIFSCSADSTLKPGAMSNFCSGYDSYAANASGSTIAEGEAHQRTRIRDLAPHQPNTGIVGIVITKQSMHSFPDKRNPGAQRFKFPFTLRDSPSDYINVTCWGSENHIKKLFSNFKICDIIELQNVQISSKPGGELEEKWRPWTPSPYQVNVSETYSTVTLYNGWDYADFTALAHVPLRPPNDYCTLSDVVHNGHSLEGSYVNLLAAVREVGAPRQMTSKTGRAITKCEVKLVDQTSVSLTMLIWDEELIQLAQTWTPKENIISAVDVKATFDSYKNAMATVCDRKTILITNPDCREAQQLYQFAQSLELEPVPTSETEEIDDIQSITDVFTVEQLQSDLMMKANEGSVFTGMLFPVLTSLDIDQSMGLVICYRCAVCKFRSEEGASECHNRSCPTLLSGEFSAEPHFNILISLADHTGSIDGVRLFGKPALELLQCLPQDFLCMSDMQRTELKGRFLLERFKVYFKSNFEKKQPNIKLLSIKLADPEEAAQYL